ncbi:MAG: hypothetical protein ACO3KK_03495 [Ilumatobacteraceae bacterium]|jgi:hypothetical protein
MNEEAELRRALRGPLGRRGADAISDAIFETRSRVQRDLDDVRRSVRRLDRLPERIERLRVVVVVAATALFLGLSGVVLVVAQFVSR